MINKAEIVARGVQEYVNKAKLKPRMKAIPIQMKEIHGYRPANKGFYHSLQYENLVTTLAKTRPTYRTTIDIQERKKIAKEELKLWNDYVNIRKNEIPEEFKITKTMIGHMEEVWNMVKTRGEETMSPSKILDFHYEYTKAFKFEIPMDPRNIVQLVHPSMGYLSYLPNPISLKELLEIYETKLVATYEKSLGQSLLANEISSLAYWNFADKNRDGFMSLKQFVDFLRMFRLSVSSEKLAFMKEFKFGLQFHQNEYSKDIGEKDEITRFDFFRYIFLERNL